MNLLSKFHLNRTVNESGNAVLRKLRKLKKFVAPSGACCAKCMKNSVFVQYSRRLAESLLPPGGSSQKTQNWVNIHASPGGTFKAAKRFLGIF